MLAQYVIEDEERDAYVKIMCGAQVQSKSASSYARDDDKYTNVRLYIKCTLAKSILIHQAKRFSRN